MKQTVPLTRVSLHALVDQLIKGLLPTAVSSNSLIINDIDHGISVQTDENMLAYVLWNLINRVVQSTSDECIHIEALLDGGCTVIRVNEAGTYFYRLLNNGFRQVQQAAERLGGTISIDNNLVKGVSVAFNLDNEHFNLRNSLEDSLEGDLEPGRKCA
ncbi:MAG: sensor histidine kinase [Puia sp.]|nr:sensor histidine kinase [Puia sp.]